MTVEFSQNFFEKLRSTKDGINMIVLNGIINNYNIKNALIK